MRTRVKAIFYSKRVYDDPEVVVRDGHLSRGIKALRNRVGILGTFGILKARKLHPGQSDRKRAKRYRAEKRILAKKRKEMR